MSKMIANRASDDTRELSADVLNAVTGGANGGVWSPPCATDQKEPYIGGMDRIHSLLPYIEQK